MRSPSYAPDSRVSHDLMRVTRPVSSCVTEALWSSTAWSNDAHQNEHKPMSRLQLTFACGNYDRVTALRTGDVTVEVPSWNINYVQEGKPATFGK